MNRKKFFARAAVLLISTAAAAFAFFVRSGETGSAAEAESRQESLWPSFAPESVTRLRIEAGKDVLTMVSRDGRWIIPEAGDASASRSAVTELLLSLSRTVPLREIPVSGEEMLRSLNLSSDPELKPGYGGGIRLTLSGDSGEILSVLMGRAHVRKQEELNGSASRMSYDGRYLRTDGQDGAAHIFLVSRVFENCIPSISAWLEPLRIESISSGVRSIQFMQVGKDGKKTPVWAVVPDPATRSFTLIYPAGSVLALPDLVKRLEQLSSPFSRGLVQPEEAAKLSFDRSLTLACGNGVVSTVDFAARSDGTSAARLSEKFYPERFPRATGESDADHERRRQEQAFRVSEMGKAFSGRVFVVDSSLPALLAEVPEQKLPAAPVGMKRQEKKK